MSGNGAHGIEFVSDNYNSQFNLMTIVDNTGDGIRFTASDDNVIVSQSDIRKNGGYGINIVDATTTNTLISSNSFVSNTSGEVNNSGTGTLIRSNLGVVDN